MRLPTFSILRSLKFKPVRYHIPRTFSSDNVQTKINEEKLAGDPSLIEFLPSWKEDEEVGLRARVTRDMQVLPDFVTEEEEASLLAELEPVLKRMRYEFDHWDNAIQGFRETERSNWNEANSKVLARVRDVAFASPAVGEPLPHTHVLDLAAAGFIKPHVDAVRFCGGVIAGLCLASGAVMRLRHEQHQHLALDALIDRRCLYIMRGTARYDFNHAVLGGEESAWRGQKLPRRRRIAVITRSKPDKHEQ
ncbi:hypothetical protein ABMA28_009070 [Loxostege sticticalis]|uniref:Alpha-ketoglutarate-dependent dioxygenase AlkB-like domain-containing protein n=1 Tax=Loxostege sticticalis TaxID=481309 RepID=A0ABD0SFL9_LOXSC